MVWMGWMDGGMRLDGGMVLNVPDVPVMGP